MEVSYCALHPSNDNISKCKNCYESWPENYKGKYTRAQCKNSNWVGKLDHNTFREHALVPKDYLI